ncbi:hypothetical protein [uncultured Massilia sp.]|uniref:hypothetical protein n=1 Tax=uncultured Massilia sp. TaxID=169973 RepID=UPI0025F4B406|nr:hypothetical protein [uncultured Massilia sp.]
MLFAATAGASTAGYAQSGAAQPETDPAQAALHAEARTAEARAAIAEAERAELLARLPPSTTRPLAGSIDTKQFGAAGLVKAFDLARQLAGEVCAVVPAGRRAVLYEPAAAQGVLAARLVDDALERLAADLARQNAQLQQVIDAHAPAGARALSPLAVLTVVPATLKAAADFGAPFKTNLDVDGIGYGDGARGLFATALAHACPERIAGLGSGYLGELDAARYAGLLARVRMLATQRAEFANRIAVLQKLADGAKGEEKKELAALASGAGALLKTVDGFVESLKAGEAGDKSPLFNAARYLGYAARTEGMLVLDVDLRLEGMTIVKDSLFTGQKLRLSGVAFLWYRLHAPDGTILAADALRRITRPVEVDLRGADAGGEFWK